MKEEDEEVHRHGTRLGTFGDKDSRTDRDKLHLLEPFPGCRVSDKS